ncbi:unnamed protein product [Prorocentrum cordatum]|uniref:SAP domain-containing protein n=1 Tax=Prorocentrum cordatum TaxID=2364126 RepID=A0ABN9SFK1_9DINO|nr:unnamed protein product [Polarella glacialis]
MVADKYPFPTKLLMVDFRLGDSASKPILSLLEATGMCMCPGGDLSQGIPLARRNNTLSFNAKTFRTTMEAKGFAASANANEQQEEDFMPSPGASGRGGPAAAAPLGPAAAAAPAGPAQPAAGRPTRGAERVARRPVPQRGGQQIALHPESRVEDARATLRELGAPIHGRKGELRAGASDAGRRLTAQQNRMKKLERRREESAQGGPAIAPRAVAGPAAPSDAERTSGNWADIGGEEPPAADIFATTLVMVDRGTLVFNAVSMPTSAVKDCAVASASSFMEGTHLAAADIKADGEPAILNPVEEVRKKQSKSAKLGEKRGNLTDSQGTGAIKAPSRRFQAQLWTCKFHLEKRCGMRITAEAPIWRWLTRYVSWATGPKPWELRPRTQRPLPMVVPTAAEQKAKAEAEAAAAPGSPRQGAPGQGAQPAAGGEEGSPPEAKLDGATRGLRGVFDLKATDVIGQGRHSHLKRDGLRPMHGDVMLRPNAEHIEGLIYAMGMEEAKLAKVYGLNVKKESGENSVVDLGTKAHPEARFEHLRDLAGIVDCAEMGKHKELEAFSVAASASWARQGLLATLLAQGATPSSATTSCELGACSPKTTCLVGVRRDAAEIMLESNGKEKKERVLTALSAALDGAVERGAGRRCQRRPFVEALPALPPACPRRRAADFPSDDVSVGSVAYTARLPGVAVGDVLAITALDVLGRFLTGLSSSPLEQEFVQCEPPVASGITCEVNTTAEPYVAVELQGVPFRASPAERRASKKLGGGPEDAFQPLETGDPLLDKFAPNCEFAAAPSLPSGPTSGVINT